MTAGADFPAAPAATLSDRMAPCDRCGERPSRRFMNARLCSSCAPTNPTPDPERTAVALRTARWERIGRRA